jgi:hypothetical protein
MVHEENFISVTSETGDELFKELLEGDAARTSHLSAFRKRCAKLAKRYAKAMQNQR